MSSAAENESSTPPSKIALGELLKRVQDDSALVADIKDAFVADLESESPSTLAHLKAAIAKEASDHAA